MREKNLILQTVLIQCFNVLIQKERINQRIVFREIHLRTTGRHLSLGSHSVICHPTEVTPDPQPALNATLPLYITLY